MSLKIPAKTVGLKCSKGSGYTCHVSQNVLSHAVYSSTGCFPHGRQLLVMA